MQREQRDQLARLTAEHAFAADDMQRSRTDLRVNLNTRYVSAPRRSSTLNKWSRRPPAPPSTRMRSDSNRSAAASASSRSLVSFSTGCGSMFSIPASVSAQTESRFAYEQVDRQTKLRPTISLKDSGKVGGSDAGLCPGGRRCSCDGQTEEVSR
jgi:hypothetical protein